MTTRAAGAITLGIALSVLYSAYEAPVSVQSAPPLVHAEDFRYFGSFVVPWSDGSGSSTGYLSYGGTALSVSPRGLYVGCHDWYQQLAEISIPEVGGTATVLHPCVDVTEGRMGLIDESTMKLFGTLVHNGRLITTAYSYYDADVDATLSHFASSVDLSTQGDVSGPVQVGTAGAGFVAGYMGVIPSEWRDALGGPTLTGLCCTAIIGRSSSGPTVSSFDPDAIGNTYVPATQLVGYPLTHQLVDSSVANTFFTQADGVGGVAFPAGTSSVLFVGRHGTGAPCYGTGAECGDPSNASKGNHAYPYTHYVWAYDANELALVKLGSLQPWEVKPYATWALPDMDNTGGASISSAAYDPASRRLYVAPNFGESPRVHVYVLGLPTPEPTPTPTPDPTPTPTPTPEPTPSPTPSPSTYTVTIPSQTITIPSRTCTARVAPDGAATLTCMP